MPWKIDVTPPRDRVPAASRREETVVGTVVVTGATGTVGRWVVEELAARGAQVRVASRTADGAGSVRFSFTDATTWEPAFTGASGLFLMRPPQIGNVRRDLLPAVAAARELGVSRVAFLSVLGAEHNPLLPHRAVERWLDGSGMAATHVRAGNFMQNLVTAHRADIRDRDVLAVPAGNARMSYVDARDVGAVAARCLVEDGHAGRAYDVTGPRAISHAEISAILSAVLGRPITYTRPSLPRYWCHAAPTGMSPPTVLVTSALYTLARVGIGARVTADVERVLHRKATDFHEFALDHRKEWKRP